MRNSYILTSEAAHGDITGRLQGIWNNIGTIGNDMNNAISHYRLVS